MNEHETNRENGETGSSTVAKRESENREREKSRVHSQDGDEHRKPEAREEKKAPGKPPKKVLIIASLVFLLLAIGGVLYYLHARNYESTDDAFTAGHVHEISARVPGTILTVLVDDNQAVHQGQILATLDTRDFDLALEKAGAQLAQARASTQQAEAEVRQREAATSQASAQLDKARIDDERASGLFQHDMKAVSKADVDATNAQLKTTQAAFDAARANEIAARAQEAVARAGVKNAEAAVHDAELQLSYTKILAPVDGFVSKKTVETGRRIEPGQALMAVVEPNVWVVANLKETQLAKVNVGQSVAIEIDAIPGREFAGRVDSFQAGTGATFALLPPDNATGNFTKIVQRVPVKIVFDQESVRDYRNRIVPGLSAVPKIDLRSR
jgi:membrane fusion protein (multidrug efflux system)